MSARVQTDPFDTAAELAGFGQGAGAVVTFTGLVRDDTGTMQALEIEHYPGMTERALTDYGEQAAARFGLSDWRIIHRHGRLSVGEPIMMVATAARHRRAAFDAADYLMDWLKSRAPFWKREIGPDGQGEWVAAKDSDEAALSRW
ncbi:MAG: molybdenum cofactor biosynthesis protein MoaE [Paracoccus sp. (in: a-proteobacteria)]|uniref:molybdenum cofactor biosynthesis protein MoaE n=1 Tax=Paracoccus sp. TaxID=267 RepID=UPI0026DEADEF|nr:molybdenum cofactor biosynthesis protein MoaE [Paracoccus sp. (in: a-proteobacteria)]MDO5613114.1 molybdenum cofactor biosynthesis protein MoaE [Paracoccus sp. (in: a-proteobacteria)]